MTSLIHSSLSTIVVKSTPLVISGVVCKGFGRGGKLLGCPTANIDIEASGVNLDDNDNGIYFGWALLNGEIYKMVTSIGWNPQFKNEKKTIEPHIIHKFDHDFYDQPISIVVLGYLRPEQSYSSMDLLVEDIQNDIKVASEALDDEKYKNHQQLLLQVQQDVPAVEPNNEVENNAEKAE